jgi:hypothetical protein
MTLSVDFKLKAGLLSQDFDLVPKEADALRNLLRTAVIHVEGRDLGTYYGELFDLAVGKMRTIEPVATREEFVKAASQVLNGEYAPLRHANRLLPISANNAEHDVQNMLDDAVTEFACQGWHLPEETQTIQYDFCQLQGGKVGALREGSVFVRRTSAIATALQPVPYLWFDGSRVVRLTTAMERDSKLRCSGSQTYAKAEDILTSMSTICSLLSYVPGVGSVAGFTSEALTIAATLFGASSKPSAEKALLAVTRIMQTNSLREKVREKLADIKTWEGLLSQQHVGLAQAEADEKNPQINPENKDLCAQFIHDSYMPALTAQVNQTGSGLVLNSLTQLQSLWSTTPWAEMDLRGDILKALALALGHALVIWRDRVLLCARMVASKDPKWRDDYTLSRVNTCYAQYRNAVYGDPFVNPSWLKGRIQEWMEMRRYERTPHDHYYNHGSNYYGIAYNHTWDYPSELYWIEDHGRCDSKGQPGKPFSWKSDSMVALSSDLQALERCALTHQQAIDSETRTNLVPLLTRCNEMVSAFNSLKI